MDLSQLFYTVIAESSLLLTVCMGNWKQERQVEIPRKSDKHGAVKKKKKMKLWIYPLLEATCTVTLANPPGRPHV